MPATPAQQTAIARLYLAFFDRAPDAAGFDFWVAALANGATLASITSSFLTTPEARTIYPASQTSEQFVSGFYQAVFGRAADASGLAFWTGVLNAAGGSGSDAARAQLVAQIVSIVSTPLSTKPAELSDAQYAQTVADRDLFAKKVVASLDFAINTKSNDLTLAKQLIATLEAPVTPAPTSPPALVAGETFLLTTGTNIFTGGAGDDIFDGRYGSGGQTLGNLDRLDGGAGDDTLYATIALSSGTPTFSNIENVVLNSISSSAVLDLRNATGFTKVQFAASTATGKADYTETAALSVVDQNADVYFRASKASNLSLALNNVGTVGTPTLVSVNNTLSLADVASITHNIVMADARVSLQVSGNVPVQTMNVAATGSNMLNLTTTGADSIQTIAVTGTGAVDFSGSANNSGNALIGLTRFTAADGGVNMRTDQNAVGSLTVITGAGADTITANGASIASLAVGAGNDVVTLTAAPRSGAIIELGDGDDTLTLGVEFTPGATIRGGDGRDMLVINDVVPSYQAVNETTGFEVLALGMSVPNMDVASITNGIHSFVVRGVGATQFTNALSTSTFTVDTSNNVSLVSIDNASGQTAANITLNNAAATSGAGRLSTLTVDATAVSLASSGSGSNTNVILSFNNADNSVITIRGAADLMFGTGLNATALGSRVDASSFTGKLTITGSNQSDTIVGGAGDDVIDGGVVTHGVAAAAAIGEVHSVRILTGGAADGSFKVNGFTLGWDHNPSMSSISEVGDFIAWLASGVVNYSRSVGPAPLDNMRYDTGSQSVVMTYLAAAGNVADGSTVFVDGGGVTFGPANVVTQGAAAVTGVAGSVDTLTGGAGADTFLFRTADVDSASGAATAIITDFQTGVDRIQVTHGGVAVPGSSTSVMKVVDPFGSLAALLTAADTALAGNVKYYIGTFGGSAYVVTDGDGVGYTNVIQLAGIALAGITNDDIIGP